METSTGALIIDEGIFTKQMTITFTIKKAAVVATTVITFLSGTVGPFVYTQYTKKIDRVKSDMKQLYETDIKNANAKAEEADKIKLEFTSIVSQLQNSVDFLKVHTAYNTAYILYTETPSPENTKNYYNLVSKYSQFIKNRRMYPNSSQNTSFYLSDTVVYVDGVKYVIPVDVLSATNDLKNNDKINARVATKRK